VFEANVVKWRKYKYQKKKKKKKKKKKERKKKKKKKKKKKNKKKKKKKQPAKALCPGWSLVGGQGSRIQLEGGGREGYWTGTVIFTRVVHLKKNNEKVC